MHSEDLVVCCNARTNRDAVHRLNDAFAYTAGCESLASTKLSLEAAGCLNQTEDMIGNVGTTITLGPSR